MEDRVLAAMRDLQHISVVSNAVGVHSLPVSAHVESQKSSCQRLWSDLK